jgi:two-component system NtrC family sensor kinase
MKFMKISVRLTIVLGLSLSVLAGFAIFWLILYQQNHLLREITFAAQRLAETAKLGLKYDMLNNNRENIQRDLEEIGKQKDLERIRILNPEGVISYSSDSAEIAQVVDMADATRSPDPSGKKLSMEPPDKQRSRVFRIKQGHRVIDAMDVIYNENSCWTSSCHEHPQNQKVLGIVDIALSLEDADDRLSGVTRTAVIPAGICILCICGLVGFFVQQYIASPIKRLLAATVRIGEGDLDQRIAVKSSDELGALTESFNFMAVQLKSHIHKLTETQECLFHSQRLASLGKMAAGIAHEINSPLTVILNDSSLLLRNMPDGKSEKDELRIIVAEAKRCGDIVKNLLEFTRMVGPEKTLADINEVLRETMVLAKYLGVISSMDVRYDLSPGLPRVNIDTNQMKQVFLDILTNASAAMPSGGSLTIRTGRSEGNAPVVASITDTGCGIPEQNMQKIFEPFFTTKDAQAGTGLGLAICYEIVQKHNGKISVKSAVGAGTTFTIELPAADSEDRHLMGGER